MLVAWSAYETPPRRQAGVSCFCSISITKTPKVMNKKISTQRYLIMRGLILHLFLIFSAASLAGVSPISGQGVLQKKISLSVENMKIRNILKKLEETAAIRFAYQPKLFDDNQKVSLAVEDTQLITVLGALFDAEITFEEVGQFVIIKPILASTSQTITVTGKVANETGVSLPGVNVLEKGTANGTVTDVEGSFTLEAASNSSVLVFSFIGYESKEVAVGSQVNFEITLRADVKKLEEVVVVGYGTQKKTDLTGAVASVRLEDLKDSPNTNIGQFLQGTVPGLNVGIATSSGKTPPISIRGRVSLSGNQNVLIILDSVQFNTSLSSINPDDIASVDVLKDASSTAIYGAQAANGVILITSRKGKPSTRPRIAFRSAYTWQTPTLGSLVPKNREQYLEGIKDAYYDRAYTLESGYTEPNPSFDVKTAVDGSMRDPATGELLPHDFNWWKAGTNTGVIRENNLSLSGGSDAVSYMLSAGIVDQKGFIINDKFVRNTVRANLEVKPLSGLKIGLISSGSFVNQDGAEPTVNGLQRMSPLLVPFDKNGELITNPFQNIEQSPFVTYYVDDYERHNYYCANAYAEIDFPFLKGLSYRLNFGNNYRSDKHYYASPFENGSTGRAYKEDEQYYDYM